MPCFKRLSMLVATVALAACSTPGQPPAKPSAPTSVYAIAVSGIIVVSWTDTSSNEQGFRVRRQTIDHSSTEGQPEFIGEVGANVTRFEDQSASPEHSYRYFVSAFNEVGESEGVQQSSSDVSPVPKVLTLNVSVTGTGEGSVGSSPKGVDCGTICSAQYADGTTVFLTANPSAGSAFVAWGGACSGTSLTCSVKVSDNLLVSAKFDKLPPAPSGKETLAVSRSGSGLGSVVSDPSGIDCGANCVATFDTNSVVTLTAMASGSAAFGGWDGDCSGSQTSCTISMSIARSVTASFVGSFTLNVIKAGDGSGTVTSSQADVDCGSDCEASLPEGTQVVLVASPAEGSTFTGWSGGGCSGQGACAVTIGGPTTVVATFSRSPVVMSVQVEGPGKVTSSPAGIDCGSDCTELIAPGTQFMLTAEAESNADFLGWSGSCGGTSTTCIVTMDAPKSVTARFGDTAIVVNSLVATKNGPDCTLRAAVEAANTDRAVGGCRAGNGADVIRLPEAAIFDLLAVDNTTHGRNGLPSITSRITIQGNSSTVQRGPTEEKFRIFHVSQNGHLTIEDLTIKNGHGDNFGGGGIYVAGGQLELMGSWVTENHGAHSEDGLGAGLLARGGIISIQSSIFTLNENSWGDFYGDSSGAAIAVVDSDLTIRSTEIRRNVAGHVAGIHILGNHSTADIEGTIIEDNEGLALSSEGSLWLTNSTLRRNALGQGNAGMQNHGSAYLDNVTYERHSAEGGGGIQNHGYMAISNSAIRHNSAGEYGTGGGIANSGQMVIRHSTIVDNEAAGSIDTGGGIHNSGELLIANSEVIENESNDGGGIWNTGHLTLESSLVDGNHAYRSGGGILNLGYVSLTGTSSVGGLQGNSAEFGGGIASGLEWEPDGYRSVSLQDSSSIKNNRAVEDGGGIFAFDRLSLSICNSCSITLNQVDSDRDGNGEGGGVFGALVSLSSDAVARIFDNNPDDIAPGGTVRARVSSPYDDAEEFHSATTRPPLPAGTVYHEGEDLELTYDPGSGLQSDQIVGIRFPNLRVPRGARIVAAHIRFTTDEVGSGHTSLRIRVQDSVNPAQFVRGEGSFSISSRPTRSEYRDWTPEPWTVVNESGPRQRTPDLTYMVQRMVDRPDWTLNSSLAFIIQGTQQQGPGATRTAHAFEGDASRAPMLVISYFDPP